MEVYYFLWIIIMVGLLWKKPKYKEYWFIAVVLTILLLVGLRSENIGFDTRHYLDFFMYQESSNTLYTRDGIEPGFSIYFAIIEFIWRNQKFATFITAFFSLYPVFLLINKKSSNPILSIFLFCSFSIGNSILLTEMAAMRQCLAIGFYAMGLYYYIENNNKFDRKSVSFFFAMIFTHYSSLLVILLFLLERVPIKKKVYYYSISSAACLSGFFIGNFIDSIQLLAASLDQGFYVSNYGKASNSIIPLIPYWGTFVFLIYETPREKINSLWIKGFFLAVCFTGILQTFGNNIDRTCAYYYITTFIAIPEMIKNMKHKKFHKWIFYTALLGYFSYKYFLTLQIASQIDYGQVPYCSFL